MADKNFKVKNKLVINGLAGNAGPLIADGSNVIDSTPYIATQYGGTGTTTSPSAGQVLYSSAGTTYTPTTLSSLVQGAKYQADAPSSPATGDIWIESDSNSDSFDPNIIRRKSFTATAGQTAFVTDVNFVDGYEQVYFNGLLLLRTTDYTTSGNNTITLVSAAALNDIIEVVTVTNLNSTNTYTQAEIDAALSAKLSTSTAASTYLTQSNASSTYLSQSTASSTYLTQSNASSTYAPLSNPTFTAIGGDEGGQINFAAAATNTTLSGPINLDVWRNRIRLFEGGGNNRGAFIDLTTLSNGVGSELIAASPQSGQSGKYLTTDGTSASWATVSAGAGNMVQIATGTLSGASLTLSGLSSYTELLFIAYQTTNASDGIPYLRINNNSTANTYQQIGHTQTPSGGDIWRINNSDLVYLHNSNYGNVQSNNNSNIYSVRFFNCKNPGFTTYDITTNVYAGNTYFNISKGVYKVSETVSSLVFSNWGGNWTAGTYVLWGA